MPLEQQQSWACLQQRNIADAAQLLKPAACPVGIRTANPPTDFIDNQIRKGKLHGKWTFPIYYKSRTSLKLVPFKIKHPLESQVFLGEDHCSASLPPSFNKLMNFQDSILSSLHSGLFGALGDVWAGPTLKGQRCWVWSNSTHTHTTDRLMGFSSKTVDNLPASLSWRKAG